MSTTLLKPVLLIGAVGAGVTGAIAEVTVATLDTVGMGTPERISLVVGLITFIGSFMTGVFMLGRRFAAWEQAQREAEEARRRVRRLELLLLEARVVPAEAMLRDHLTPKEDVE